MPRLKRPKHVNFFLRIPPDAKAQVEAIAQAQGQKPVVLGRQIIEDWAKAQNQKTPAA